MATSTHKPIRRRRLAKRLEELRIKSGKTQADAAEAINLSPATMSRYEEAKTRIPVGNTIALCDVYKADARTKQRLTDMARRAEDIGWWNSYGGAAAEWFLDYLALEADAVSMWEYEAELVPGLLQTAEYAAEVTSRMWPTSTPDEEGIERRVNLRIDRQKAAFDRPKPLEMWTVLNEAVLRRPCGSSGIWRDQLEHIIEMASRPKVTIQVLPFSAGAHPGMLSSFVMLNFPDPDVEPSTVYLEQRTSSLYLEDKRDLDAYTLSVEYLRARSLDPDQSVGLIGVIASDLARSHS